MSSNRTLGFVAGGAHNGPSRCKIRNLSPILGGLDESGVQGEYAVADNRRIA